MRLQLTKIECMLDNNIHRIQQAAYTGRLFTIMQCG